MYIIRQQGTSGNLSSSFPNLLAKDELVSLYKQITGKALASRRKPILLPSRRRIPGQPKACARGGFAFSYNGLEPWLLAQHRGKLPLPIQFLFSKPDANHPITFPGCTDGCPGGSATF